VAVVLKYGSLNCVKEFCFVLVAMHKESINVGICDSYTTLWWLFLSCTTNCFKLSVYIATDTMQPAFTVEICQIVHSSRSAKPL